MQPFTFESVLKRPEGTGTWTYLDIPFNVAEAFGQKGQVRVKGTINGHSFRGSAMPHGDGTHYIVVNQAVRSAIGVKQGDTVQVVMEVDSEPRTVSVPEDLTRALGKHPEARSAFESLSYSHQKQYVEWISEAKQATTRQDRIEKAIEMLPKKMVPKGKK